MASARSWVDRAEENAAGLRETYRIAVLERKKNRPKGRLSKGRLATGALAGLRVTATLARHAA